MARVIYSANIEDVRGKLGHTVHTRARSGKTLRSTAVPKRTVKPSQAQSRYRVARVSRLYKSLTPTQLAAWKAYAATLVKHDSVTNKTYAPAPGTVFCALASKFLQYRPGDPVPLTPPTAPFVGDSQNLILSTATGQIQVYTQDPNSDNVATEVWLQPLPSNARHPSAKAYTSAGFIQFSRDTDTLILNVIPGWYAVAYSYLQFETGQKTPCVLLGTVKV